MKNWKDILKATLVFGFAVTAIIVVFIKSYTSPNVNAPLLQSLIFTLIVSLFSWFVLGRPSFHKKRSIEETIEEFKANGYYAVENMDNNLFNAADKVICLQKESIYLNCAFYNSLMSAGADFTKIKRSLSQSANHVVYTHEKQLGKRQEFAIQADAQSSILCLNEQSIVYIHSDDKNIDEIKAIAKAVSN